MINAIGDRIVIQPEEPSKISSGGIHLITNQSAQFWAKVLSVGNDVKYIKVGDRVLSESIYGFSRVTQIQDSNGTLITIMVVKESEILGVDI